MHDRALGEQHNNKIKKGFEIMKKIKKLSMMALGLAAVLTVGAATASATTVNDSIALDSPLEFGEVYIDPLDGGVRPMTPEELSLDGMTLIEETETVEDGLRIVDRIYMSEASDNDTIPLNKATAVTRERAIFDTGSSYGTLLLTMRVNAIFTPDGETVYLMVPGRSHIETGAGKGSYVREKSFCFGDDQGSNAFFGNKYAYVENVIVAKVNGVEKEYSLYLEVNRNGTIKVSI